MRLRSCEAHVVDRYRQKYHLQNCLASSSYGGSHPPPELLKTPCKAMASADQDFTIR
jgi:hypothetical protein